MPMSDKDKLELVTSGPYAFIRHPINTGLILGMLGSALGVYSGGVEAVSREKQESDCLPGRSCSRARRLATGVKFAGDLTANARGETFAML